MEAAAKPPCVSVCVCVHVVPARSRGGRCSARKADSVPRKHWAIMRGPWGSAGAAWLAADISGPTSHSLMRKLRVRARGQSGWCQKDTAARTGDEAEVGPALVHLNA